ncbi:hypothetical protein K2173_000233 [Erythroxylum novogranatense]|uniref:Uncharacterized protein n=1 Tax=Erythroxylum novogranatense TaxID=1862640 RepID=A0AAV8SVP7_9ROSI|nr:hypothetical protein K2173_000233 [Erythroxylum novogranatense]
MNLKAWHGRQAQRVTLVEKLRFQALKANDQEAYMRLAKESKNECLVMLLEETNKLFVNLGDKVQSQKGEKHSDGIEPLEESEYESPEGDDSRDQRMWQTVTAIVILLFSIVRIGSIVDPGG